MKIILGVLASDDDGYDKMVQAAKDTCYKDIPSEFEVFYLYGQRRGVDIPKGSYKLNGNDFYYDFTEARRFILVKTIAFFKYCCDNKDFDYIFRPNCGSYISLPLLKKFVEKNNLPLNDVYLGVPNNNTTPGIEFASGSGYLISKNLVEALVESSENLIYDSHIHYNNFPMMDDAVVGSFLYNSLGLKATKGLHKSVKFTDSQDSEDIRNILVDDECYHYYFCHSLEPKCFYVIHNKLKNLGIVQ